MRPGLRYLAALLCTLMYFDAVACAAMPPDFFEVVNVTPSRLIKHEVQSKSVFDNDAIETELVGPQLFSHAVGSADEAIQEPIAYLNWYEIARPPKKPTKAVEVRDALRGKDAYSITIGSSAFLLSPAQRITTGSPSPIPDGLNHFKAYRILDAPPVSKMIKLSGTLGPKDRTATRAIFLCVPIEQWHHDEHFRVKDSRVCLIVYELLPQTRRVSLTTLDQFGLNTLEADSSNWLCVPATIIERQPHEHAQ